MAFHVEVATAKLHARSFNLTAEELKRTVLDPWLAGRPVLLGDRRWTRADSGLRIFEGPAMSNQDLAFGQGWANAERASADVTAAVLADAREAQGSVPGPTAIVVRSDSAARTVADLLAGQDAESVSIEAVRQLLDGEDAAVAAVIVVVDTA